MTWAPKAGGLVDAVEHVLAAAAQIWIPAFLAEFLDSIVGGILVVATTTWSTAFACLARSTTQASIGWPAMSSSTFPGRRAEAIRA